MIFNYQPYSINTILLSYEFIQIIFVSKQVSSRFDVYNRFVLLQVSWFPRSAGSSSDQLVAIICCCYCLPIHLISCRLRAHGCLVSASFRILDALRMTSFSERIVRAVVVCCSAFALASEHVSAGKAGGRQKFHEFFENSLDKYTYKAGGARAPGRCAVRNCDGRKRASVITGCFACREERWFDDWQDANFGNRAPVLSVLGSNHDYTDVSVVASEDVGYSAIAPFERW